MPKQQLNIGKISVIIPAYNAQDTIERCINSVFNQDYDNIEIIVVDDGSNDNTLNILNNINKDHFNVSLVTQNNSGPSAARNAGIKIASGDWIFFLDSDDTIVPDCFECFCIIADRFCKQHDNYPDIIVPRAFVLEDNKKPNARFSEEISELGDDLQIANFVADVIEDKDWKTRYPLFYSWGKLIKSSIIKSSGVMFDETICHAEDALFSVELLGSVKSICEFDRPLYIYNFHQSSLSNINRDARQSCEAGIRFYKILRHTYSDEVFKQIPKLNIQPIKVCEIATIDYIRQQDISHKDVLRTMKMLMDDKTIIRGAKDFLPENKIDKIFRRLLLGRHYKLLSVFIYLCNKLKLFQS